MHETETKTALLIGGTGFSGRHLASALAELGYRIYFLTHAQDLELARQQIHEALLLAQNERPGHPLLTDYEVLCLNDDNQTITPATLYQELKVDEVWHILDTPYHYEGTGSLPFVTDNLVLLASRLRAGRVILVTSDLTASVMRNHIAKSATEMLRYEEIERKIEEQCTENEMAPNFIRLGLTLSQTPFFINNQVSSLSTLASMLIAGNALNDFSAASPDIASSHLRIMSVSGLVDAFKELLKQSFYNKKRLHIHGDEVIKLEDILRLLRRLSAATKSKINSGGLVDPALLKYILGDILFTPATLEPYVSNTVPVVIDDVTNELAQFIRHLSGDSARQVFNTTSLSTSNSVPLRTHHRAGSREAILFVNAYGMTPDLLVPLVRELRDVDFYTWESRYVPLISNTFDRDRTDIACHAEDLLNVMDHYGLDRIHLAGWCTGAQVCLRFAHEYPERTKSLILINGAFSLVSLKKVEFHTSILGLLERASLGLDNAKPMQQLLYSDKSLEAALTLENAFNQANAIPMQDEPHLAQMLSQLYCTPEILNRYAAMAIRLWEGPAHAWTENIQAPTLVLTGSQDIMSPPHTSREIAEMLPMASITELSNGDHYMLYHHHAQVAHEIEVFIDKLKEMD